MASKVYLSSAGRVLDPGEASVSVFDRGFLYGDSVYETLRTAGGRPVELARHLDRLRRSALGIGLEIPFTDVALRAAIAETHAASGNADSYVRVIVTRGTGPLMLDPRVSSSPLLVVLVQELKLPTAALYEAGLSVRIVDVHKISARSLDPTLKTGNYLNSIQALRQAAESAAEDAILCSPAGDVAEGATSNVFMVRAGELLTPALATGLLEGITRALVLALATELGIGWRETKIWPDELRAADEVFLTSSVRGAMPVTTLDGQRVGAGGVGPVTRRILTRYQAYIDAVAGGADDLLR
ncbi:MAG: aminotransferase class IV [Nannocystis sp.]|uniref:aminotransferase class IV n=1 Tax=Nannocystis sp. TaxID=1962667 RepID=UPI002424DF24|nr:aminotransferase class IV [Nannocystis sp.]MBK9754300.1 aminotransferase class IV [Nannocystis sp.]